MASKKTIKHKYMALTTINTVPQTKEGGELNPDLLSEESLKAFLDGGFIKRVQIKEVKDNG